MKQANVALRLAWVFALGVAVARGQAANRESYTLESKRGRGALDRVEVVFDVEGSLLVPSPGTTASSSRPPMKAAANLTYEEKTLALPATGEGVLRSVRFYDKAEATIRVGEEDFRPSLRSERRVMVNEVDGATITLFNPSGTLTRDELDLVDLFGNSLLLDGLLPERPVALNESWKHPDWLMTALCTLDAIGSNDAQSVLRLVSDGVARMEMSGRVEGIADGRSTVIEIKAKYRFDTKTGRITWFGLVLKENREAGPLGPGLDVVARLQMKVAPMEQPVHLSEAALRDAQVTATPELTQLHYRSPDGGWEMAYDRRWVVVQERNDSVLLRMADGGDYIAQCNVATGNDPPAGKDLTLAKFQEEVRRALGKSFGRAVQGKESAGEGGLRVYHVVVEGEAQQVPIQWVYYRLANPRGRQIILAFTVKRDLLGRFEQADEDLVRTLRFVDPKVAAR